MPQVVCFTEHDKHDLQILLDKHVGSTDADSTRQLGVYAPARSEIAGNHTDHEGGHVIAGALDVCAQGLACANNSSMIRVISQGYDPFEVSLEHLDVCTEERGTTASLVRGMAFELAMSGRTPSGFDLAIKSNIPAGGGLSSSAAIEALLGRCMEALWPGRSIAPLELAQMSQRVENLYYGKPCGLMDQASVCLGGLAYMDFEDPTSPRTQKIELSFEEMGYALCLLDVGADHTEFTHEYAAVAQEMQEVAAYFRRTRLCEVSKTEFSEHVAELRKTLGDRAIMRAVHYWIENDLVDERWQALCDKNMDTFVDLTRRSSQSSGMFLQNVSAPGSYQPAMLAIALAEYLLRGRGCARIHGGGFGGSIQVFVPLDTVEEFVCSMNKWFGENACRQYRISPVGACAFTLE